MFLFQLRSSPRRLVSPRRLSASISISLKESDRYFREVMLSIPSRVSMELLPRSSVSIPERAKTGLTSLSSQLSRLRSFSFFSEERISTLVMGQSHKSSVSSCVIPESGEISLTRLYPRSSSFSFVIPESGEISVILLEPRLSFSRLFRPDRADRSRIALSYSDSSFREVFPLRKERSEMPWLPRVSVSRDGRLSITWKSETGRVLRLISLSFFSSERKDKSAMGRLPRLRDSRSFIRLRNERSPISTL